MALDIHYVLGILKLQWRCPKKLMSVVMGRQMRAAILGPMEKYPTKMYINTRFSSKTDR
jgi:hypothetical protein